MNSMNKIFLFTCLIGLAGSINAFSWQDVKKSCSGLYRTCAESLSEGSTALSEGACNKYQACVDFVCKKANSVATSAIELKDSTVIKVGNLCDATAKATAPVVDPVVSTAKTGANGVVSTAHFVYEHPKKVIFTTLATTAAYLAHCRNATLHWILDLNEAKDAIKKGISPNNNFKDWRTKPQADKPALSIADLMSEPQRTYSSLKLERGLINENDNAFIIRLLGNHGKRGELQEEQDILEKQANRIKSHCLAHAHLLPSLRSHEYKKNNNFVTRLIQERIDAMDNSDRYIDLSEEQMDYIDEQIHNKTAISYFNPLKIARRLALPYEAAAINQYWEIYQSIQRLEALKDCIQKEKERRNAQHDPAAARIVSTKPQLAVVPVEASAQPVDNLQ